MTLAVDLAALHRLQNPRAVVVDTRQWAQHVGIVAKDSDAAVGFTTRHVIRRDFPRNSCDRKTALKNAHSRFKTDRHVYVGVEDSRILAEGSEWEFLYVETAAEMAGWLLGEDTCDDRTLRARLRKLF